MQKPKKSVIRVTRLNNEYFNKIFVKLCETQVVLLNKTCWVTQLVLMGIFGTVRKLALKILDTPFWQSQTFHLFSPKFLMKRKKKKSKCPHMKYIWLFWSSLIFLVNKHLKNISLMLNVICLETTKIWGKYYWVKFKPSFNIITNFFF